MIEFNGTTQIITIDEYKINVETVYLSWKDWVLKDNNSNYLNAFVKENNVYYLINGWDIRPKADNGALIVLGNISFGNK